MRSAVRLKQAFGGQQLFSRSKTCWHTCLSEKNSESEKQVDRELRRALSKSYERYRILLRLSRFRFLLQSSSRVYLKLACRKTSYRFSASQSISLRAILNCHSA